MAQPGGKRHRNTSKVPNARYDYCCNGHFGPFRSARSKCSVGKCPAYRASLLSQTLEHELRKRWGAEKWLQHKASAEARIAATQAVEADDADAHPAPHATEHAHAA